MTFLHPALFAAGVACIAIPILIHLLLRQRRRPVEWGAMRFLLEAFRRQRRRLRLQQILLLATRCLIVLLLGAAIARPLLDRAGLGGAAGGRTVYLLIDNGLASSVTTEEEGAERRTALDRLKASAREVLASLGPTDRAGLVTLGGPAEAVVVPASADLAAVSNLVRDIEPTEAGTDMAGALERLAEQMARDEEDAGRAGARTVIAVFSDFLLGSADVSRPLPTALAEREGVSIIAMRPAERGAGNVQIVDVEPLRPVVLTGGAASGSSPAREQVRITLRRSGEAVSQAAASVVRLRVGGADVMRQAASAQGVVRWQPGQSEASVALQVDPTGRDAEGSSFDTVLAAEIDRDALAGDNIFLRPIGVREALRVGVVARRAFVTASVDQMSPAAWLRLALRPSFTAPMDVVDVDPGAIDAALLATLDVAFLPSPDLVTDDGWARLRQFVLGGGLLVVSPPAEASVHLWSDDLTSAMGLPWRIAREPIESTGEGARTGLDDSAPSSALLSLIASEMPALSRSVSVFRSLPAEEVGRRTEVLMRLADGTPWLIADEPGDDGAETPESTRAARSGRGLVVYLASAPALSWTDLPAKPLMVPLVQELARQGFGAAAGSWAAPAGRPVPVPARTARLEPTESGGSGGSGGRAVGVTEAGVSDRALRRAGLWVARDEAGRERGLVAVNADAEAGRTTAQDPGAVRAWIQGAMGGREAEFATPESGWLEPGALSEALRAEDADSPWSFPLLLAALALAVAEVFMARWFSHAFVDRGGPELSSTAVGAAS